MLMSFVRGLGLIFMYLLPFTHKMPYHYRSHRQHIRGDWQRIGGDLQRALQSEAEKPSQQTEHKG